MSEPIKYKGSTSAEILREAEASDDFAYVEELEVALNRLEALETVCREIIEEAPDEPESRVGKAFMTPKQQIAQKLKAALEAK